MPTVGVTWPWLQANVPLWHIALIVLGLSVYVVYLAPVLRSAMTAVMFELNVHGRFQRKATRSLKFFEEYVEHRTVSSLLIIDWETLMSHH
jgi:hypothetical protein